MEKYTWKKTRWLISQDRQRLVKMLTVGQNQHIGGAYLHPSFICVFLYRLSNHFYRADYRLVARIIWHLNLLVTGADISEPANIGPGFVVMNSPGTHIMGSAGCNLTIGACSGLGGEVGRGTDVGAGPGFCMLGDDVTLEAHTAILGPVKVGNRVRICASAVLTKDVADDNEVLPPKNRLISTSNPQEKPTNG